MGGADTAGFRAILTGLSGTGRHFTIRDLVAEGDLVVAHFTLDVTRAGGEKLTADGLTLYRLADGRIVEDDPFTRPDLAQVLGMVPPAARPRSGFVATTPEGREGRPVS
jgi:ketosteroid isomerase-like protein